MDADNQTATVYSYDWTGRLTSLGEGAQASSGTVGAPARYTQTAYDDANRRVTVQRDQSSALDGKLVSVTNYDQLYRPTLTQQLENYPSQSPTDITAGIKVQTRYLYGTGNSYKLVSNPYRSATSTAASAEPTMGWTLFVYDQNGRQMQKGAYTGSGLPKPWGSNTDDGGDAYTRYNGSTTTFTDESNNARSTTTDGADAS